MNIIAVSTSRQIEEAYGNAVRCGNELALYALQTGNLLNQAKLEVEHGEWEDYVKARGIPASTARKWQKISRDFESAKTLKLSDLDEAESVEDLKRIVTAAQPEEDPEKEPKKPKLDDNREFVEEAEEPCANCRGIEWVKSEGSKEFDECRACGHAWGEPAGDLDEGSDEWKKYHTKAIRSLEGSIRAVCDLHNVKARPVIRNKALDALEGVIVTVRDW